MARKTPKDFGRLTLKITPGLKSFVNAMPEVKKELLDLRGVWQRMVPSIAANYRVNLKSGGHKALQEQYRERKERENRGDTILIRTRELWEHLSSTNRIVVKTTKRALRVGFKDSRLGVKAKALHFGAQRKGRGLLVARPFFFVGPSLQSKLAAEIEQHIDRVLGNAAGRIGTST